jgi:flagellar basal-body rod protein FlgC
MMEPLTSALQVAGSGLRAQTERMRIISENLANAQSTGAAPGADAFRRKLITFGATEVEGGGHDLVTVSSIKRDPSPFRIEHDPSHPAADAQGMVKLPNVSTLIELADMREAGRAYEANLQAIRQARQMIQATLDMLRER